MVERMNRTPNVETRLTQIGTFNAENPKRLGFIYQGIEQPRIQRIDIYERNGSVTSEWRLDGEELEDDDLDRVADLLKEPPKLTPDDLFLLATIPEDRWVDLRRSHDVANLKRLSDRGLIEWRKGTVKRLTGPRTVLHS